MYQKLTKWIDLARQCCDQQKKKELFTLFVLVLDHFWSLVVTSVTFSNKLGNFENNPKNLKKSKKKSQKLKVQKNPKKKKKKKNIHYNQKTCQKKSKIRKSEKI